MNNGNPRHFDPLRNRLPENWTNSDATKYSSRCTWKKCKCQLTINTPNDCNTVADKWDPCGSCESKWVQGCNPCSNYHKSNQKYAYTYNRKNCGCSEENQAPGTDCGCDQKYNKHCGKSDYLSDCESVCSKSYNPCNPCDDNSCPEEVIIKYVSSNVPIACDNVVELKIPPGGSKAQYLAKFSSEFIYNNRFQCALPSVYNNCPSNVIDNRREEEFTESDQKALVLRNIKNIVLAESFVTRIRHKHSIPSPALLNGTYYYLGGPENRNGSNQTGLYGGQITGKPYFNQCNC